MRKMRNLRGFTLIELIVVILILGILAAIAVVGYTQITERAQETALKANAKQVVSALSADATLAESSVAEYLEDADRLENGDADYADVDAFLDARFPGVGATYDATTDTVTVSNSAGHVDIDASGSVAQAGDVVAP